MTVAHQLLPETDRDFRQADFDLAQELDVGDQKIVYERDPYLRHHGVFACPQKGLDLQVLLYPLEEQLDLPSPLVNCCDGRGGQPEVVGQEDVILVRLRVVEHHAPQFPRIRLLYVLKLQLHCVVGHDAQFFVLGEVLSDNLEPCVLLEPCDEEGAFAALSFGGGVVSMPNTNVHFLFSAFCLRFCCSDGFFPFILRFSTLF